MIAIQVRDLGVLCDMEDSECGRLRLVDVARDFCVRRGTPVQMPNEECQGVLQVSRAVEPERQRRLG